MAKHAGRPKRAAEDFARTHHDHEFGPSNFKKPRFDIRNPSALAPDALEDDVVLEADVIGKRGQQVRRKAVNVDGYDSDSDNENFDTRAEARAKAQEAVAKSKDEEENDMFADLEDDFRDGDDSEGDDKRKAGRKKDVRFLDADEIEGQVQNSKSGGHVSADFRINQKGKNAVDENDDGSSSSESEVDDETRASAGGVDAELGAGSKKIHAPKLDAFNMRNENEEGRFDEQGNYVRKAADPDAVHDSWLEGLSRKDMRKAKEAHDQRENQRRERDIRDDSQSIGDILKKLIPLLESGETVLEALGRLGKAKGSKSKTNGRQKKAKKEESDPDMAQADEVETKRKETIEAITEAADMLLTRGQTDIYEAEKELLLRQYRRETGEDFVLRTSEMKTEGQGESKTMWEYRWSDARDGGEVHGPYDGATMQQWNDAGYFGAGVEFRRQDSTGSWSHLVDFV